MRKILYAVTAMMEIGIVSIALAINPNFKKATIEPSEEIAAETLEEESEPAEKPVFECETRHIETVAAPKPTTSAAETTEAETIAETEEPTTAEATSECETETTAEPEHSTVYEVDGITFSPEVQEFLQSELDAQGIGWWMPYAMAQICQESHFDVNAVSLNGMDKGLLQYREIYWAGVAKEYGYEGANVFDYYAQIAVYSRQMASRLNAGESIEQAISDHYTGGAWYDGQYVADVLQWVSTERLSEQ